MGFGNNGTKFAYYAEGLSPADVFTVGMKRLDKLPISADRPARPVVDVDCNAVAYVLGRKSRNPASAVAKFLQQSSLSGFIMSPICDGDTQPVAKQATNDHRADRERQKHKAIKSRNALRSLNRELNSSQLSSDDRSALITWRGKLENGIKTSKTQSSAAVPTDFPALL